ncbi:class I SAM-dependent methyltransferase [Roseomonas sp. CECT 9278]|uniref:class I SAM-dependent methyltransferase n=1 Tax=Roseomonas sp. CECT 9278 TaxID=2845823 RepID=UPI001E43C17F|nr:class I SAM-dependent methyltransferase [Roseomonas sp. CECT 9278]CAH0193632.1 hypothetical protein ROS9278_01748 [Roseomonas sp. CECT 9278]
MPLDVLSSNLDDVRRYGLTRLDLSTRAVARVDTSEFLRHFDGPDSLLPQMLHGVAAGRWALHAFYPANDQVIADIGIVIPASIARDAKFRLLLNGQTELDRIEHRDRVFSYSHWFMPAGHVRGFRSVFAPNALGDWARLSIVFDEPYSGLNRHFRDVWNYAHSGMLGGLPDVARIHRVASPNANQPSFLNGGKTAFENLCGIAKEFGVEVRNGAKSVLDWGVGCGRLVRHFNKETDARVTGIDIDSDNVAWCNANLRGTFHTVGLHPPTELPDAAFDLIYACSVLSHLTEPDADAWLAEIARVLAPGGLALLSFHGTSNSISYLSRRPSELRRVLAGGFFDKDVSNDLKGFIPSDEYYRQSFSTDIWWRRTFEKHFEMAAVEVSVLSGFQHIAVLRKK